MAVIPNKKPFYYGEISLIGLLLLINGFLVSVLVNTIIERTNAFNILRVKKDISDHVTAGYDIRGVSEQIVREISMLLPGAGVELYLYPTNQTRLIQSAFINMDHPTDQAAQLQSGVDPCRGCFIHKSTQRHSVIACQRLNCPMFSASQNDYCMQLSHGDWLLGVLHLVPSTGDALPESQVNLIENVASDISSALGIALRKFERDDLALVQKINSVQLEIARDLHDTIGQNVSYLRMKLEHLADSYQDAAISPEITLLSNVANESYDLVRGTLAMLQPNHSAHLHELFTGHANQVMDRSDLVINIECHGEPRNITTRQMRQLYYVFREALNNVEKHAHASQVMVEINWLKPEVCLTITDNGRGFDPDHPAPNGHYGLKFMRERVEQLNGNCSLWSQAGSGTRVTVCFPYEIVTSSHETPQEIHNN